MRVIIAGSRTVAEPDVLEALDRCPWIGFASAVVSGTAKGADQFGERWAERERLEIIRFPADWKKHGKRAGPIRNREMAQNAEGLVAVWDGASRGTASMIDLGRKHELRVFVYRTDSHATETFEATGSVRVRWEDAEERAAMLEYGGDIERREAERRAGLEVRQRGAHHLPARQS